MPWKSIDTYKDGQYCTVVTNEDITVYRSFGYNAEAGGAFVTSNPALSRVQTKVGSPVSKRNVSTGKHGNAADRK